MQLLLLSLLAVASCVAASPACTQDEVNKCSNGQTISENYPVKVEQLDAFCPIAISGLSCQIDFAARCPKSMHFTFRQSLVEYKRIFEKLCTDTDLRRIYLKVGGCMNKVKDDLFNQCNEDVYAPVDCKKIASAIQCTRDGVVKLCGTEAGELFDEQMKPRIEIHKVLCRTP